MPAPFLQYPREDGMTEFWRKHSVHGITFFLLLPALLCFFGLFFYPMLLTVILSFRPEGQELGWTLENYTRFLSDADGRWVILLTFILSLASTALSVLLSVPLALTLREKVRGHRLYRLMILVPLVIPGLIGADGATRGTRAAGLGHVSGARGIPGVPARAAPGPVLRRATLTRRATRASPLPVRVPPAVPPCGGYRPRRGVAARGGAGVGIRRWVRPPSALRGS